jgi:ribosome-binding factor A
VPKEFQRSRRVEEQIQRLLAELIRREVKDPRVGLVTITAVEVTRDLSHAKVFFLPFDGKRPIADVLAALASAAGFLRIHLKKQMQMRHVPELQFLPDETIDRAVRLSALINTAVADDARKAASAPPEPAADAAESGDDSEP